MMWGSAFAMMGVSGSWRLTSGGTVSDELGRLGQSLDDTYCLLQPSPVVSFILRRDWSEVMLLVGAYYCRNRTRAHRRRLSAHGGKWDVVVPGYPSADWALARLEELKSEGRPPATSSDARKITPEKLSAINVQMRLLASAASSRPNGLPIDKSVVSDCVLNLAFWEDTFGSRTVLGGEGGTSSVLRSCSARSGHHDCS